MRRYEDRVDPEHHLAPEVRQRMAHDLLRADMARLALISSKARKRKAG
jgi:hypothetical protein